MISVGDISTDHVRSPIFNGMVRLIVSFCDVRFGYGVHYIVTESAKGCTKSQCHGSQIYIERID